MPAKPIQLPEGEHAKFSPSAASRWTNCLGSIPAENAEVLKDKSSIYADEGTAAHYILSEFLDKKKIPEVGDIIEFPEHHIVVDWEMLRHAKEVKQYLNQLAIDNNTRVPYVTETRVYPYAGYEDVIYGTADILVGPYKGALGTTIDVVDYKYGGGVVVEATDNLQLMLYALGVLEETTKRIDNIVLTIIQPRAPHRDGPVRSTSITPDDLREVLEHIPHVINEIEGGNHRETTGAWCHFCKRAAICATLQSETEEGLSHDMRETVVSSMDEIARRLSLVPLMNTWTKAIMQLGTELLCKGEKIPGYKLVEATKHRQFIDGVDEKLLKSYGVKNPFAKAKLATPKQILDRIEDEAIRETVEEDLIHRPAGHAVMATADDKRKDYLEIDEKEFQNE